MACPVKRKSNPPLHQLSLSGKKEQASHSLLLPLSPGLQLLVELKGLWYLGGGGKERRERGCNFTKSGPFPLF
jgi:hypothetical protein